MFNSNGIFTPRTNLAVENPDTENKFKEYKICGYSVSELYCPKSNSQGLLPGRYITIYCPMIKYLDSETFWSLTNVISSVLKGFCEYVTGTPIDSKTKILVAGLGNRFITSDAIGPKTADKIAVNGHIINENNISDFCGSSILSAIHPGVAGQTGIEAADIIKGAADYTKPDIIIAVDALAARNVERLASTVQITDTGIEPGSGIGNKRNAINRETVGCPVVAIGVPTVVDSATLIFDSLESAGINISDSDIEKLLADGGFFVSLRDSDVATEEISSLLAAAINKAFSAH